MRSILRGQASLPRCRLTRRVPSGSTNTALWTRPLHTSAPCYVEERERSRSAVQERKSHSTPPHHVDLGAETSQCTIRRWKPSSPDGIEALAALKTLLSHAVEKSVHVPHTNTALPVQQAQDLPLSPVEKHLRPGKKFAMKRDPTDEELQRIGNNPWAAMLAAPVRRDAVTRLCSLTSLMTSVGYLENPADGETYAVPDTLSDLVAFQETLDSDLPPKPFTNSSTSPQQKGSRAITYRLLFEEVSDSTMVWNPIDNAGRIKPSAVTKRLLPVNFHSQMSKADAYRKASKGYWDVIEAEGKLDGAAFRRPGPAPDLTAIKWDASIVQRIPDIMGQRVLLAFQHVLKEAEKAKARQQGITFQIALPQKDLTLADLLNKDTSENMQVFWNDMDDLERPGVIDGEARRKVQAGARPPIAVQPEEIGRTVGEDGPDAPGAQSWLPGSFLVHFGPSSEVLPLVRTITEVESSDDVQARYTPSKYLPPMIRVDNHHVPVFNLSKMLGKQLFPLLQELKDGHKPWNDIGHEPTLAAQECALIRSTAIGSHYLLAELWQLWRFLGGTDCLRADQGDLAVLSATLDVSSKTLKSMDQRILKSRGTYTSMSDAALGHVRSLLDIKSEVIAEEAAMTKQEDGQSVAAQAAL